MRYKHLLVILLLVVITACGQKRALFLPQEPSENAEEPIPQEKQQLPKKPVKDKPL